MLDLRDDPVVTLTTLALSVETERVRTGERVPKVLLTYDQMRDVYGELQKQIRFGDVPTFDGDVKWSGVRLTCEEPV
jgi:hypothetical protein